MAASSLDIELSEYWSLISPAQKESLLGVIKSFVESYGIKNQELHEPDTTYNSGDWGLPLEILQQLTLEQKEAVINLVESFGIEIPGQRISIEQYNKSISFFSCPGVYLKLLSRCLTKSLMPWLWTGLCFNRFGKLRLITKKEQENLTPYINSI